MLLRPLTISSRLLELRFAIDDLTSSSLSNDRAAFSHAGRAYRQ
jgi:hypothetical protein